MAIIESCLSNSCEVLECDLIEVIVIIVTSAQFDAAVPESHRYALVITNIKN
jgi:hypothetical protein